MLALSRERTAPDARVFLVGGLIDTSSSKLLTVARFLPL